MIESIKDIIENPGNPLQPDVGLQTKTIIPLPKEITSKPAPDDPNIPVRQRQYVKEGLANGRLTEADVLRIEKAEIEFCREKERERREFGKRPDDSLEFHPLYPIKKIKRIKKKAKKTPEYWREWRKTHKDTRTYSDRAEYMRKYLRVYMKKYRAKQNHV